MDSIRVGLTRTLHLPHARKGGVRWAWRGVGGPACRRWRGGASPGPTCAGSWGPPGYCTCTCTCTRTCTCTSYLGLPQHGHLPGVDPVRAVLPGVVHPGPRSAVGSQQSAQPADSSKQPHLSILSSMALVAAFSWAVDRLLLPTTTILLPATILTA